MKRGLIQGSIAGGLVLVYGLIAMLIYPPFTIEYVLSMTIVNAIGNFIAGVILDRWS